MRGNTGNIFPSFQAVHVECMADWCVLVSPAFVVSLRRRTIISGLQKSDSHIFFCCVGGDVYSNECCCAGCCGLLVPTASSSHTRVLNLAGCVKVSNIPKG